MIDPMKDGLPPSQPTTKAPDGDDVFLFGGIERVTSMVHGGRRISPDLYAACRKLITRVHALEAALEHREKVMGIHQEDDAA